MDELLKLLDNDARLTNEQLAIMLNCSEEEIRGRIAALEKSGALRAYKAVIDWDKTTRNRVTAIIELKVIPRPDVGFEAILQITPSAIPIEEAMKPGIAAENIVCVSARYIYLRQLDKGISKTSPSCARVASGKIVCISSRKKSIDGNREE